MSNGELLRGLLDMVRFGWIARILYKLLKTLEYCTKLSKIVEYCTSAQNYIKLPKIAQVLRARPTQSIAHLTIAITLPLIVSRKGWLTQPQPSPLPLFYSLYPVGAPL